MGVGGSCYRANHLRGLPHGLPHDRSRAWMAHMGRGPRNSSPATPLSCPRAPPSQSPSLPIYLIHTPPPLSRTSSATVAIVGRGLSHTPMLQTTTLIPSLPLDPIVPSQPLPHRASNAQVSAENNHTKDICAREDAPTGRHARDLDRRRRSEQPREGKSE